MAATAGIVVAVGVLVVFAQRELLLDDLAGTDAGARQNVAEATTELAWLLLAPLPVVVVAVAALVWSLVSRTLQPVDVSGVHAAQVRIEERALGLAVRNLLDDSIRPAAITVTLRLDQTATGVRLRVADDGPGIPVGMRDAVFERFTRLDEARSSDDGGSGLGLAIVRDVVQRCGGHVSAGTAATERGERSSRCSYRGRVDRSTGSSGLIDPVPQGGRCHGRQLRSDIRSARTRLERAVRAPCHVLPKPSGIGAMGDFRRIGRRQLDHDRFQWPGYPTAILDDGRNGLFRRSAVAPDGDCRHHQIPAQVRDDHDWRYSAVVGGLVHPQRLRRPFRRHLPVDE